MTIGFNNHFKKINKAFEIIVDEEPYKVWSRISLTAQINKKIRGQYKLRLGSLKYFLKVQNLYKIYKNPSPVVTYIFIKRKRGYNKW